MKIQSMFSSALGKRIVFGRHFFLDLTGGEIQIGDDTAFADRCRIVVTRTPPARLTIGRRCFFASGVLIGAGKRIDIGDDVLVGEYTSIRDSSHRFESRSSPINTQGESFSPVTIGSDVWIGRGCLIIGTGAGITIGKGAVVGANSVVRENVPEYAVVVGAPLRVIGYRQ